VLDEMGFVMSQHLDSVGTNSTCTNAATGIPELIGDLPDVIPLAKSKNAT
jgi:hypothetical protein